MSRIVISVVIAFVMSVAVAVAQQRTAGLQAVDGTKYDQLVARTYFQTLRFSTGAGNYVDYSFKNSAPTQTNKWAWNLHDGRYNQLKGYWIFRTDANQAWQCRDTNGLLALWNADGRATGNPQDWELFLVEAVDKAQSSIRLKNVYGRYVRRDGATNTFRCDGSKDAAQVFFVEF